MFKRKKKTGCETPKFSKPTVPPQPNVPTMPTTTKPPNVGSSVQRSHQPCPYETPCGWCSKWDKKCNRQPYKRTNQREMIVIDDTVDPVLRDIVLGNGLKRIDTQSTSSLELEEILKENVYER